MELESPLQFPERNFTESVCLHQNALIAVIKSSEYAVVSHSGLNTDEKILAAGTAATKYNFAVRKSPWRNY